MAAIALVASTIMVSLGVSAAVIGLTVDYAFDAVARVCVGVAAALTVALIIDAIDRERTGSAAPDDALASRPMRR